jgi:hypothetical protein
MDWGILYQLTFFLALGLLAIVITVFVFAVSQVGRATESASREQQSILLGQKEAKGQQIEKIQQQLEEAKKAGQLDESKLLEELQKTKEDIASYDAQLKRLQERITLIRRRGAVVCPGAFFLTALVLTITASGLAGGQNFIALPLWIISIGALVFGGCRVFRTLGAIEEVTITSQEATGKLPEAVKAALRELEEERKPELQLKFKGKEFPLHVKADSEVKLPLELSVRKGEFAEDIAVHICASPGFDFPKEDTYNLDPDDRYYPNYICLRWQPTGRLVKGLKMTTTKTIKSPPTAGSFKIVYYIFCMGYRSERTELDIIVEESDVPFPE